MPSGARAPNRASLWGPILTVEQWVIGRPRQHRSGRRGGVIVSAQKHILIVDDDQALQKMCG